MKKCIYTPHSWHSGKESAFQCLRCWRHGLIPGLGRSPGGENSNLLPPWKIPWTEEPDRCSPLGCRSQTRLSTHTHTHTHIHTFIYMCVCELNRGLASFFCKEPVSKYFRNLQAKRLNWKYYVGAYVYTRNSKYSQIFVDEIQNIIILIFHNVHLLVFFAKLCLTLCNPLDCSTPGFPILHY